MPTITTPHTPRRRLARFQETLEALRRHGFTVPLVHAATARPSSNIPRPLFPRASRHHAVWVPYLAKEEAAPELHPILTWKATVAHLRTIEPGNSVSYNRTFVASRRSRIAVLPVGYADGYNRLLSNRGVVLIGGRRVPVVGRVCMDMTMVDVTDVPGVEVGHEAILIGQQGREQITATDWPTGNRRFPMKFSAPSGPACPADTTFLNPAAPLHTPFVMVSVRKTLGSICSFAARVSPCLPFRFPHSRRRFHFEFMETPSRERTE